MVQTILYLQLAVALLSAAVVRNTVILSDRQLENGIGITLALLAFTAPIAVGVILRSVPDNAPGKDRQLLSSLALAVVHATAWLLTTH